MKELRKRWEAHFLGAEFALGIVAVGALVFWAEALGGADDLGCFLNDHGETFYVVLAPITAALLGFILAAVAIVVTAAPTERMEVLRGSAHYDDLWACFRSAMRYLGLATVFAIVGLIVTDDVASRIVFFATTGFTILATLRVARCIWAMNWVIKIFTAAPPAPDADEDPEPEEADEQDNGA